MILPTHRVRMHVTKGPVGSCRYYCRNKQYRQLFNIVSRGQMFHRGRSQVTTPNIPSSGIGDQAMVLSSVLPPLLAKVVGKIKSGQYVPIKDLLAENMSLCTQLEALPGPHSIYAGFAKHPVPADLGVVFPSIHGSTHP